MRQSNRNSNNVALFLALPFFVSERKKLLNVYDKNFSSQNLKEESMVAIPLYGC